MFLVELLNIYIYICIMNHICQNSAKNMYIYFIKTIDEKFFRLSAMMW